MSRTVGCRVFGHRWQFGVDGRDLRWQCTRTGCGAAGRREYADAAVAKSFLAQMRRVQPGPPRLLTALFSGWVAPRGTSGGAGRGPDGSTRDQQT